MMICLRRLTVCLCVLIGFAMQRPALAQSRFIRPRDLAQLAKSAPAEIAHILRDIAQPHDIVSFTDGKEWRIEPLSNYPMDSVIVLHVVADGKRRTEKVDKKDIDDVRYYEQVALKQIDQISKVSKSPDLALSFAEQAILAVLWFHRGGRNRPLVGDNPWEDIELQIQKQLHRIRTARLDHYRKTAKTAEEWNTSLQYADRLMNGPSVDSAVRNGVGRLWVAVAEKRIAADDWPAARNIFSRLQAALLDDSPGAKKVESQLIARASRLVKEAESLSDTDAVKKLQSALEIWPRLSGARTQLLKRQNRYEILYVGVRQLPVWLSPETAWLDSEKLALDLIFERLVQPVYDPSLGQRYIPQLAAKVRKPSPYRFRVRLPSDGYWSDGSRITSLDVRHTVQLLSHAEDNPAWAELIEAPQVVDPLTIQFDLKQGLFQPWSYLSFPIVPARYKKREVRRRDEEFAKNPVGSGPYRLAGTMMDGKETYKKFVLNDAFFARRGTRLPQIHEIRMFQVDDAIAAAKSYADRLFLITDVRGEKFRELQKRNTLKSASLSGRRIYFLALNHRVPALANSDLRRALAHAIDRQTILNRVFRGVRQKMIPIGPFMLPYFWEPKVDVDWHATLNGPYPSDSWACCPPPRVPQNLYNRDLAKTYFRKAHKQIGDISLTLLCPEGNSSVEHACRLMATEFETVAKEAGVSIRVTTKIVTPRELKQSIDKRDYQLAYMRHDFSDALYPLWPIFYSRAGAVEPNGGNYLGYRDDSALQSLFRDQISHRHFDAIQETTHGIHARLYERMPLIPLWRLHRHIVYSPRLQFVGHDTVRLFDHIAGWKVHAK